MLHVERAVRRRADVDGADASVHGKSFEWCSSSVVNTTASGAMGSARANLLIASVVFLVNTTTSRPGSAPRNSPTISLARSNTLVHSRDL